MSRQQYLAFGVNDIVGEALDHRLGLLFLLLVESSHDQNHKNEFRSTYGQWDDITRKAVALVPPLEFEKSHDFYLRSLEARQKAYEMILRDIDAGSLPLARYDR